MNRTELKNIHHFVTESYKTRLSYSSSVGKKINKKNQEKERAKQEQNDELWDIAGHYWTLMEYKDLSKGYDKYVTAYILHWRITFLVADISTTNSPLFLLFLYSTRISFIYSIPYMYMYIYMV